MIISEELTVGDILEWTADRIILGGEKLKRTANAYFEELGELQYGKLTSGMQNLVDEGVLSAAEADRLLQGVPMAMGGLTKDKNIDSIVARGAEVKSIIKQPKLTSSIKDDMFLVRAAEEATQNQEVKRDMDHLVVELSKGNFQAGLGLESLKGTGISYMRSKGGARLFFRRTNEGYEIVAKASKSNEKRVIEHLRLLYGKT